MSSQKTEVRRRQSPSRRPARADDQSVFWFRLAAFLIGLILRFWVRCYRAYGVEHVPRTGGTFIVCNHTTGMDPFLLGYPLRQRIPQGPGKIEIFRYPLIAFVMRKIGIFPLRQNMADVAAVRTMIELYRAGRLIIVFPEGGRSKSGEMRPFNPDFARLILKLKAPVYPVAVAGGKDLLPVRTLIPRRHTPVAVVFGEQLDLTAFYGHPLTPEMAQGASTAMEESIAALLTVARHKRAEIERTC